MALVEQRDYEETEDFLAALRGSNDDLWSQLPESWIFRGHADADWALLPAALRENSRLTHHAKKSPGPYATTESQLGVEAKEIFRFAEASNQSGLAIPGGWNSARRLLGADFTPGTPFPPFEYWDLFALAQHHGVPTRFLDWSRAPLTAAYFAAHGATEMMNAPKMQDGKRLGVWALNTTALWRKAGDDESVHLVDPPRYGNSNLIAQDGVFTLHTHPWSPEDPPRCERLDAVVARLYAERGIGNVKMRLLTLPARKARKLLVRLEAEHVTAARLFPGYDGVVRAMGEAITHSQSEWCAPAREE